MVPSTGATSRMQPPGWKLTVVPIHSLPSLQPGPLPSGAVPEKETESESEETIAERLCTISNEISKIDVKTEELIKRKQELIAEKQLRREREMPVPSPQLQREESYKWGVALPTKKKPDESTQGSAPSNESLSESEKWGEPWAEKYPWDSPVSSPRVDEPSSKSTDSIHTYSLTSPCPGEGLGDTWENCPPNNWCTSCSKCKVCESCTPPCPEAAIPSPVSKASVNSAPWCPGADGWDCPQENCCDHCNKCKICAPCKTPCAKDSCSGKLNERKARDSTDKREATLQRMREYSAS